MGIADDAVEIRAQGWRTLAALHGLIEAALERALQAARASVVEYTVLDALSRQDGWHMRMQQLARAAALSPAAPPPGWSTASRTAACSPASLRRRPSRHLHRAHPGGPGAARPGRPTHDRTSTARWPRPGADPELGPAGRRAAPAAGRHGVSGGLGPWSGPRFRRMPGPVRAPQPERGRSRPARKSRSTAFSVSRIASSYAVRASPTGRAGAGSRPARPAGSRSRRAAARRPARPARPGPAAGPAGEADRDGPVERHHRRRPHLRPAGRRARRPAPSRSRPSVGASACTAAIAACRRTGRAAGGAAPRGPARRPRRSRARSQRARSCSASSSSRPSGPTRVVPPGVGEQDQRRAGRPRPASPGSSAAQHPGQVQRPLDQVAADQVGAGRRGVAGGEQQVHHREHGVDPLGQLVGRRHPVRDAGGGDLLLRPGDPGRHRRLADQERAGHLGGGQPAQQPQRERDLRLRSRAPGGSR